MDRIVFLGSHIDDNVANVILAQLLFLDAEDPERDIYLYINSPGGSVYAGLAIFDTMRHLRAPVSTYCVGMAASMAAILVASGAPGKRSALPNSRIMIHQPSTGGAGHRGRHRDRRPRGAGHPRAAQRDPRGLHRAADRRRSRRTWTATASWAPTRRAITA